MRKLFLSTLITIGVLPWIYFFTTAFNSAKCEHVFTQVEQAVIKIDVPTFTLGGQGYQMHSWPLGVQDGKDIVCVKCFQVQKQKLDYGAATTVPTLTDLPIRGVSAVDSCGPFATHFIFSDTVGRLIITSPK